MYARTNGRWNGLETHRCHNPSYSAYKCSTFSFSLVVDAEESLEDAGRYRKKARKTFNHSST